MVTSSSERLIQAGFLSKEGNKKLKDKDGASLKDEALKEELNKLKEDNKEEEIEKYADHHLVEVSGDQLQLTEYPTPINSYYLIYESFKKPLEAYYFWSLNHLNDLGFGKVHKITDIFAASEQSALYGSSAQRLGLAQDKVVNFLVSIGRLVKELFQIVREIRIIDERITYFDLIDPKKEKDENVRASAEITLKSLFVEQVEGGAKNTNSVYGLARELNFSTLPDLFFTYNPQTFKEVGALANKLAKDKTYNRKVREVLQKKLLQYLNWRKGNEKELRNRRDHTLKYLNQHYQAIQMYLSWVKPYLKHIKRLSQKGDFLDSADLIASFEGSVMEIEILGEQVVKDAGDFRACMLLNFKYRTAPTMSFQGQDYKQGPIHMGKVEVIWRSYCWTPEQVKSFIDMKKREDLDLFAKINPSIQAAMEGLGDSLERYLKESQPGYKKKEEEEKEKKKGMEYPSIVDPFVSAYRGFKEVFKPLAPSFKDLKKKFYPVSASKWDENKKKSGEKDTAMGLARTLCWTHYKNFKKKHGFPTW